MIEQISNYVGEIPRDSYKQQILINQPSFCSPFLDSEKKMTSDGLAIDHPAKIHLPLVD